ncbi:hypothetical protein AAFF_G00312670 [Aldrovandia affinis]|uniref:NHS-like protein 2 n=1 Tax=Aldrovandia affinis TaxID=143900 RepID=A0AAD7SND9_9TELE|nr:hypothetical protein AAFF_G00312670 [Aldrovandia affinis]
MVSCLSPWTQWSFRGFSRRAWLVWHAEHINDDAVQPVTVRAEHRTHGRFPQVPRRVPQTDRYASRLHTGTTNLDSESKRTGHFQSSWQQHVNVLGSWSRPECVQDLHGDAQLNLQRLLQEFGEHLYDQAAVEHSLTQPCSPGLEGQSQSQVHHSSPDHPRLGPPVPEKPRWLLRPVTPTHLVLTGEGGLIQGASQPRVLTLSSESTSRLPLRNTHDDLAQRDPQPPRSGLEMMENMTLMCSSWNGPRGSTFCPTWDDTFGPYLLDSGPVATANPHPTQRASQGPSVSSGSPSSSFTSLSIETSARTQSGVVAVGSGEGRSLRADGIQYRQCPLSTPAVSDSFPPADGVCEGRTLSYQSSGSEDGGRPAIPPDGQTRERSRSISLRKLKKKPLPPARSVSLGKSQAGETPAKVYVRPKSLCLPRDLQSSLPPDIILSARQCPNLSDMPLSRAGIAAASGSSLPSQSQSSEPHRSSSSSSTAMGTTTIELPNTHGSSESLPSPSPSPSSSSQNSSQLSPQSKLLPLKPPRLMSPSSGYSSLSDTPTPTVPTSLVMGPSPLGCRMRPKVPERKSSLTPASERERAARARLSCELPLMSRLDPPSVRPKPKTSRRHSDSSATVAMMLPQKLSPGQAAMPLVTETDLRSVHLRSVGRSEAEAGPEGSSLIIQEEHDQDQNHSPVRTPNPKPKPPIPAKPLLPPKRPLSLMLNPAPSADCPPTTPATPTNRSLSLGNISQVLRKPKSKKGPAPTPPSPAWALEGTQQPRVSDHPQEAEHSDPPSETCNNSRKLPSRITISCLAELDRKQIKVPPPVPRKPGIHLLPVSGVHADQPGEPSGAQAHQDSAVSIERGPGVDLQLKAPVTCAEAGMELSQEGTEEDYDDVFVSNSTSHTTEDLFTIIHRSKRKVLGRKEPLDSFGSRQSLVSPVKADEPRCGVPTRNDTFMALLQKRNGRPGPSARLSATELLQSTKPLARRATDGLLPDSESVSCPKAPQQH